MINIGINALAEFLSYPDLKILLYAQDSTKRHLNY